jgi:hypothetical protein
LQPLDLIGEFAPLHGEIKQRAANIPIRRFLRDPVAFQRVGSAIIFGHRKRAPIIRIAQPRESRFELDQFVRDEDSPASEGCAAARRNTAARWID